MHPLMRNVVIGVVGLLIAAALTALALVNRDSDLSVLALLAAGILGTAIGLFLYSQGWIWGSRAARRREAGASVFIGVGGGLMAIVAAVAFGLLVILVRLFYLG
ncbi:MAG TPA: hypothetical protein VIH24_04560 [Candidatus Limnocylindria bacterium]